MKTTTIQALCSRLSLLALPVGLGAAFSVSNGPVVGIALGAALAIVLTAIRRR